MQAVKLGQWAAARLAYEAAVALNPTHTPALAALLHPLLRLGDWGAALRVAEALLAADPCHPLAARVSNALQAADR